MCKLVGGISIIASNELIKFLICYARSRENCHDLDFANQMLGFNAYDCHDVVFGYRRNGDARRWVVKFKQRMNFEINISG